MNLNDIKSVIKRNIHDDLGAWVSESFYALGLRNGGYALLEAHCNKGNFDMLCIVDLGNTYPAEEELGELVEYAKRELGEKEEENGRKLGYFKVPGGKAKVGHFAEGYSFFVIPDEKPPGLKGDIIFEKKFGEERPTDKEVRDAVKEYEMSLKKEGA